MKKLLIILLFFTKNVVAAEYAEIFSWLDGSWSETSSNCPTTIEFGMPNSVTINNTNSEATGTYEINKAVLIEKNSVCWSRTCYEMRFNISKTKHDYGCASKWELGNNMFMNFYTIDNNILMFGNTIKFTRNN